MLIYIDLTPQNHDLYRRYETPINYSELFPENEEKNRFGKMNDYLIDYLTGLNPKDPKFSKKRIIKQWKCKLSIH